MWFPDFLFETVSPDLPWLRGTVWVEAEGEKFRPAWSNTGDGTHRLSKGLSCPDWITRARQTKSFSTGVTTSRGPRAFRWQQ